jgi:hypothetical protein
MTKIAREYRWWTAAQDEMLIKLWKDRDTITVDTMCGVLDCNERAVYRRVDYLKLPRKVLRPNDNWTPERIQLLTDMWPNHTAAEIAVVLCTTRNAVIGKKHRLSLATGKTRDWNRTPAFVEQFDKMRREKQKRQKAALREKNKVFARAITGTGHARALPLPNYDTPQDMAAPQGKPVRLVDLTQEGCRAIVGRDPVDKLATFCPGHRIDEKMPYCRYHHEIYYNMPMRRMR